CEALVAAAGAADDGGRADHGDGGPGRPGGGDRRLLARDAPAGHGVPALALVEQDAQHRLVAERRAPAGLPPRGGPGRGGPPRRRPRPAPPRPPPPPGPTPPPGATARSAGPWPAPASRR